jgi:hypothetical protein
VQQHLPQQEIQISGLSVQAPKPLSKPTEEKQAFLWTPHLQTAFQKLKEVLGTAHILAYPQPREKFVVHTGVGNVGIEGILSQIQDGQEQVIA